MNNSSRRSSVAVLFFLLVWSGGVPGRADVKSVLAHEKEAEEKGETKDLPETSATTRMPVPIRRIGLGDLGLRLMPYRSLREEGHVEGQWTPRSYSNETDLGAVTGAKASVAPDGKSRGPAATRPVPPSTLEALRHVYATMDSVFLGPTERQSIQLKFPDAPPLSLEDLLDWVETFAFEDGRRFNDHGTGARRAEAASERDVPVGSAAARRDWSGAPPAPETDRLLPAGTVVPPTLHRPSLPAPNSSKWRPETDDVAARSPDWFDENGECRGEHRRAEFRNSSDFRVILRRMVIWADVARQKRSEIPPVYGDPRVQRALAQLAMSLETDRVR